MSLSHGLKASQSSDSSPNAFSQDPDKIKIAIHDTLRNLEDFVLKINLSRKGHKEFIFPKKYGVGGEHLMDMDLFIMIEHLGSNGKYSNFKCESARINHSDFPWPPIEYDKHTELNIIDSLGGLDCLVRGSYRLRIEFNKVQPDGQPSLPNIVAKSNWVKFYVDTDNIILDRYLIMLMKGWENSSQKKVQPFFKHPNAIFNKATNSFVVEEMQLRLDEKGEIYDNDSLIFSPTGDFTYSIYEYYKNYFIISAIGTKNIYAENIYYFPKRKLKIYHLPTMTWTDIDLYGYFLVDIDEDKKVIHVKTDKGTLESIPYLRTWENDVSYRYKLSQKLLSDWNQDTNGCSGLRCKYIDSISTNKSLIGMPKSTFLQLFGEPDYSENNNNVLKYYLCTTCDDTAEPDKNHDASWFIFSFINGELEKCTKQIQ